MNHYWIFLSETDTNATYECTACGDKVIFYKEGAGVPAASPPEVPADISNYVSLECNVINRTISKRAFLDRLTVVELGGMLSSTDPGMKIILYKFDQTVEVPLDHPETLATLQYISSIGLLAPQRIATLLA